MNLLLTGVKNDIQIELPEVKQFYQSYKELNSVFSINENKYDQLLTEYGTEDFKFAVGFLTNIYKNIDIKGYSVVNPVFDAVERFGDLRLAVFYGNRILEKYSSDETDHLLIRLETLRRILNALISIDDKLFFTKYLIDYTEHLERTLRIYPSYLKEIYMHSSDWYQFMYYYALSILGDNEKALGFVIKSYQIRKFLLEEKITDILNGNTVIFIANIVGLYSQLENSLVSIAITPEEYIEEFVKEVKLLKKELDKNPERKRFFLSGYFRKYYNELLTNIYALGFFEEHKEVVETFPEIVNKDHIIMVELDNLLHSIEDIGKEKAKEKINQIKEKMDIYFNNISKKRQESLLYIYYSVLLEIKTPEEVIKEIQKKKKYFKNSLLIELSYLKALKKAGEEEKVKKVAENIREKAIIENNRFILDALKRILSE